MDWLGKDVHPAIAALAQNADLFERLELPQMGVSGIGAAWTPHGPRPLILVNPRAAKISRRDRPRLWRPPDTPFEFVESLLPVTSLPLDLRQTLDHILPHWEESVALIAGPPEPLASIPHIASTGANWAQKKSRIRCQVERGQGTVGFGVTRYDDDGHKRDGFLTAGHVASCGLGCVIEIRKKRLALPSSWMTVGSVGVSHDSSSAPTNSANGYDVAVVDTAAPLARIRHAGSVNLPVSLQVPIDVRLFGSVTGMSAGMICGALKTYGTSQRTWQNSWILVSSEPAKNGDSGAPVVAQKNGHALGLLVGGHTLPDSPVFGVFYVQDLYCIERDVLTPLGVHIQKR